MIYTPKTKKAMIIAYNAHNGQVDKSGIPYIYHPIHLEALKLLAHDKNVDYLEYVRKIKNNPIARKVKLADLYHNSDPTRMENPTPKDLERKEKYRKSIEILKY